MRQTLCAVIASSLLWVASNAAAVPYEIPARWAGPSATLAPTGVDFAFTGIERVPRLGIVAYADRLMLRIAGDEPYVTLGIAGRRFAAAPLRYTGAAPLAGSSRLLGYHRIRHNGASAQREAGLLSVDLGRGMTSSFELSRGSDSDNAWSVIRLFTDSAGAIIAYAARDAASADDARRHSVAAATEQRFFRISAASAKGSAPLPALAPTSLSATGACLAGDTLVAVGVVLERDDEGRVRSRRGGAAELCAGRWLHATLPAPAGAGAWELLEVACGNSRDAVVAVGRAAAAGQAEDSPTLHGNWLLYRFDGRLWRETKPPAQAGCAITALGIDPAGALWLAHDSACDGSSSLYRLANDGVWLASALPQVAGTRGYTVRGIAFDEDGVGWALANLDGGIERPESHGLLLRLAGASWEHRPWTWSRLRQRWFGLLGDAS